MVPEIKFEGDKITTSISKKTNESLIERLVLKTGIVHTKNGVNIVLLVIIGICISAALFMNHDTGSIGNKYGNYDEIKKQNPDLFPE